MGIIRWFCQFRLSPVDTTVDRTSAALKVIVCFKIIIDFKNVNITKVGHSRTLNAFDYVRSLA